MARIDRKTKTINHNTTYLTTSLMNYNNKTASARTFNSLQDL